MSYETKTTIAIRPKTRDLLKSLGHKGESYDQLINRLVGERILTKK